MLVLYGETIKNTINLDMHLLSRYHPHQLCFEAVHFCCLSFYLDKIINHILDLFKFQVLTES